MSNLEIYLTVFLLYILAGKSKMFKRIFQLFKIARKLASSGAIDTVNEIYNIPFPIKLFFNLISIGSQKKKFNQYQKNQVKNL